MLPPRRPTADVTVPIASEGTSRRARTVGSHATAPASSRACIVTIGVSFRKSAGVLRGPRLDGGPSGTLYVHSIIVTAQPVTSQPKMPSRSVSRTYRPMCSLKLSTVL